MLDNLISVLLHLTITNQSSLKLSLSRSEIYGRKRSHKYVMYFCYTGEVLHPEINQLFEFEVGLQALFVFGWFYTRIDSEDNAGS